MVCDGCKVSINGMGYRCLNCPDFGHCHRCVNKNISSHHALTSLDSTNTLTQLIGNSPSVALAETCHAYVSFPGT